MKKASSRNSALDFLYFKLLNLFFSKKIKKGNLVIQFNGKEYSYGNPKELPKGIMNINNSRFFNRVIKHNETGIGESYMAKEWTTPSIEDVLAVLLLNYKTLLSQFGLFSSFAMKLSNFVLRYRLTFTKDHSKVGMSVSYDVGNDFFKKTLGESMTYTCAIFRDKKTSLEEAQNHKIEMILRKLQPRSGDKVLDIGCGWGTLLKAFQEKHQCEIRGIALAKEQIKHCKQTIPNATFEYLDYRDLKEKEVYDKVVSVGMIEHVGQENLEIYAKKIAQVLKPGGKALLHTMIKGPYFYKKPSQHKHITGFGCKYLMPVSYAPHDFELTDALLSTGSLRILHQEKFGQHYAETARRWVQNLLLHSEEIAKLYSPEHVRCYEYAWSSLAAGFSSGCGDLYQVLIEKAPLTPHISLYDPRS